jgi:hypothetical protein
MHTTCKLITIELQLRHVSAFLNAIFRESLAVFVTFQTSQTATDSYSTIFTQNTHFILPFEVNTLVGTLK